MDDDEEEEEVNPKTSEDKKIELPKIVGRRTRSVSAKIKEANSQRDHQVDDLTVDEDPEVAGNVDGNPEISAVTKDPEISVDGKNPEIPVIVKDPEIAVLGENLENPVITKDPEISVLGQNPGISVTVQDPEISVPGQNPGISVTVQDPEISVPDQNPGISAISKVPPEVPFLQWFPGQIFQVLS